MFILLLGLVVGVACAQGTPTPPPEPVVLESSTPVAPTSIPAGTALLTATATMTASPIPVSTLPLKGEPTILPILMYHHLEDLPKSASDLMRTWTVSPSNFEVQIRWLAQQGYHTVSLQQVAGYFRKGQSLPIKPIVVTFDDGWAADYTTAFPVLKRQGYIGTFFVYTNALDRKGYLKWSELEEMSRDGMEIGSHTLSHARLKTLSADELAREVTESKSILEKRVQHPVTALAYPDGEYNDVVIAALKKAGYESAVGIASGYRQRPEDVYSLHRIRVSYADSLQDLAARLP